MTPEQIEDLHDRIRRLERLIELHRAVLNDALAELDRLKAIAPKPEPKK